MHPTAFNQPGAAPCACCQPIAGRRRLGRAALFSAAAAVLAPAAATAQAVPQARPDTPAAALAALIEGNARFVAKQQQPAGCSVDLAALRQGTATGQSPFAAILSCADSRVPTELVFDQTIGDVFVARNAGNIASTDIVASLEYAAAVLGTRTILVLGHSSCGAVSAALANREVPGQISALFRSIRPAIDRAGPDMEAAVKANAQIQAALLRDGSPLLATLVREGKLGIAAGYYDLASGKVSVLG